MQTQINQGGMPPTRPSPSPESAAVNGGSRRDGAGPTACHQAQRHRGAFEASKISVAITKAFLAVEGGTAAASSRIHETVAKLTEQVTATFQRACPPAAPSISRISRTRWSWP